MAGPVRFLRAGSRLPAGGGSLHRTQGRCGRAWSNGRQQWPWSSAAAHLAGQDDRLVQVAPLLRSVRNGRSFLAEPDPKDLPKQLHTHENTGRPLGKQAFVARLEEKVGRPLAPRRPGRPRKNAGK